MSGTPTSTETTPSVRDLRATKQAATLYTRLNSEAATANDRHA